MQEDLSSKEHKWTAALSKLQEQVDSKRTETRSQRCRRILAARNTSGQLPSLSIRNRGIQKENRNKITKMQEDLSSKEHKWTAALFKIQEQVEIQREQKQDHKDAGGS
jgi:hypothetical protein